MSSGVGSAALFLELVWVIVCEWMIGQEIGCPPKS